MLQQFSIAHSSRVLLGHVLQPFGIIVLILGKQIILARAHILERDNTIVMEIHAIEDVREVICGSALIVTE